MLVLPLALRSPVIPIVRAISVALVVGLWLAASPARADEDEFLGTVRLPESVVTGTKTEHPAELAPVPTQVITRDEIDQTATTSIEQVLTQIPDMIVQQNQEFGLGASVVRMQGADPNKVAILLDGRRFRGGVDGVVDLRDIPLSNIEQIEIIRGPASSLYGSDAMAGVINIRTRTGSDTPTVDATLAGGNYSRQLYNLSHGWRLGPLRYFLSAQHDEVAVAELFGAISAQYEGESVDDTQKRDSIYGKFELPIETHTLGASVDYLKETDPVSHADDLQVGASWVWAPDPDWSTELWASRYGFQRQNDLPGFIEDVDYADWTAEARASRLWIGLPWSDHLVTGGLRARIETLTEPAREIGTTGASFLSPGVDTSATQLSPFLQDEITIDEQWSLVLGTSLDDHQNYGLQVNPRGTVNYRQSDRLRLSFTVGSGFRAPDLLQLYDVDLNNVAIVGNRVTGYAIVGNPDLEPETDLAFTFQADFPLGKATKGSIGLFRHNFDDLIANVIACPTPAMCNPGFTNPFPELQGPIFTFANVARARTQGVDVGVVSSLFDLFSDQSLAPHSLEFGLAYGYLDSRNLGDIPGEKGQSLPFRPRNRFVPSLTWSNARTLSTVRVWGEYQDLQYTDLANTPDGRVDPTWYLNLKVTQEIPGLLRLFGASTPAWVAPAGVFVQGLNVLDEVVDVVALAAQQRQFAARATVVAGLTYRLE